MSKRYIIDEAGARQLRNTVRKVERLQRPIHRRRVVASGGGGGSGGACQRAKTQEAGQSDGKVSVKLLDAAGTETGSAFDVYAFPDKATNDMGNYWPAITSGQTVVVAQIDDDWFLINPTLFTFTSIDVQTNYQVDGANSKLQKKTRSTVKVLSSGSESAWTDVHTGDTCS